MRILIILVILLHALLGGCSTVRGTVEVKVPVPVSCVAPEDIPADPQLATEEEILEMDRRKRTLTVWDERLRLKTDNEEMRALLKSCAGGE